jgi:thiosulfate dehydrogenase [quinone] large subunit
MRCETHGVDACSCSGTAEPRISRLVFGDLRFAWVWLILRLWLGWQWLESGWHKVTDPAWMQTGAAVQGFWERAVVVPETGRAPVAYDWYRAFLQEMLEGGHYLWFAKVVAVGEVAVGLALVLGALTGVAAFGGVFMNWHFVMAGAASTNAMLALVGVLLVLAWRTAGWWGLDRWVLPLLGLRRTPNQLVKAQAETPRPVETGRNRPRPSGQQPGLS